MTKTDIFNWLEKKAEKPKVPLVHREYKGNHHEVYDPTFPLTSLPALDRKDNQLRIDMHGGGHKGMYVLHDNQDASNFALERPIPFVPPLVNGELRDILKKVKEDDIDKVHSIACNLDGGGRPEFYEKLLGKDLHEVIMTPPGYYGVAGQQATNGMTYTLNTILDIMGDKGGRGAPQHIYHKQEHWMPFGIGDHWVDKGEYTPWFDHALSQAAPFAIGGGMAALAYGLYKKMKNKNKLDKVKKKVLKK